MEFERSVFRMHERVLTGRTNVALVSVCHKCMLYAFIIAIIQFVAYHKFYATRDHILRPELESQLLWNQTDGYKELPYSAVGDEFVFCNL